MLHIAKLGLSRMSYWNVCAYGPLYHFAQCSAQTFKYSTKNERSKYELQKQKQKLRQEEEDIAAEHEDEENKRKYSLIGGGLEKPQGGLSEENYFNTRNKEQITKIREEGTTLKNEENDDNWNEYRKSVESSGWRDSSSLSKHKNVLEENYFLNEQFVTLKVLADRMRGSTEKEQIEHGNEEADSGEQSKSEDQEQENLNASPTDIESILKTEEEINLDDKSKLETDEQIPTKYH